MREELSFDQLEQVNGGVVYLSKDWMKIGFSTMGLTYSLKNCTYGQAFALVDQVYEQFKDQGNAVVDRETRAAFQAKGWI